MPTNNHDLFLITQDAQGDHLTHIPVGPDGMPIAAGEAVVKGACDVPLDYSGRRKVMSLGRPSGGNEFCGAGFSVLPNRPDPDASQMSCFLIDARNLRDVNPWNAAEWSQSEDRRDESLALRDAPEFTREDFEIVLAGPAGRIYRVRRDAQGRASCDQLAEPEVALQGDLWIQLRNGLVAGTVRFVDADGQQRVLPAFNITAVMPPQQAVEENP